MSLRRAGKGKPGALRRRATFAHNLRAPRRNVQKRSSVLPRVGLAWGDAPIPYALGGDVRGGSGATPRQMTGGMGVGGGGVSALRSSLSPGFGAAVIGAPATPAAVQRRRVVGRNMPR